MTKRNPAEEALKALAPYLNESDDLIDSITDLVTDLHHLCRRELLDFDQINGVAERHFNTEVELGG